MDTSGILRNDVRETEPAGALSRRGMGQEQGAGWQRLRNFQRLEKLICWNFRSVEILRFPPPSPAPGGLRANLFSFGRGPPIRGGGDGRQDLSFTVEYFLNQS